MCGQSLVVVVPVILIWLVPSTRAKRRPSGETVLLIILFVMPMLGTLTGLYLPFWKGLDTFAGIHQESEKIVRSIYLILGNHFGISPKWTLGSSFLGNICAGIGGMLICRRRHSLIEGLLVCLLVQAVFGRTFLLPWYFCPPVMLAPLLIITTRRKHDNVYLIQRISAAEMAVLRLLLVTSASAVAGGYAVLFLAKEISPQALSLSYLCMVAPPLIVWLIRSVGFHIHFRPSANTQ